MWSTHASPYGSYTSTAQMIFISTPSMMGISHLTQSNLPYPPLPSTVMALQIPSQRSILQFTYSILIFTYSCNHLDWCHDRLENYNFSGPQNFFRLFWQIPSSFSWYLLYNFLSLYPSILTQYSLIYSSSNDITSYFTKKPDTSRIIRLELFQCLYPCRGKKSDFWFVLIALQFQRMRWPCSKPAPIPKFFTIPTSFLISKSFQY